MITVELHSEFKRLYKKRIVQDKKLIIQVEERIDIFRRDPDNVLLRDHALRGDKLGCRAFSISGDIRIVYRKSGENRVIFLDIGSHNQVY